MAGPRAAGRRAAAVAVRPAARPGHGDHRGPARWRGLLVCAIDGTTMTIPDSSRNLATYGKQANNHGGSGHPLLRLVALAACGTHTLIGAVFGPASCGEETTSGASGAVCMPCMPVSSDGVALGRIAAGRGLRCLSKSRSVRHCLRS